MKIEWIITYTTKSSISPPGYSHSGQQVIKHAFIFDELHLNFLSKIEDFDLIIICDS